MLFPGVHRFTSTRFVCVTSCKHTHHLLTSVFTEVIEKIDLALKLNHSHVFAVNVIYYRCLKTFASFLRLLYISSTNVLILFYTLL